MVELELALTAVETLAPLVAKLFANAQQSAEWTPAQEQTFRDRMNTAFSGAAWKPES